MINIIFEDNHLLVVEKPVNIPVQEDSSKDKDLLNILKDYIKKRDNKPGNVYLGLVHRLDRPVGGIMVFAKTSKCAKRVSEQIQNHAFKKTYYAVVMNKIEEKKGTYIDYLLKDTKKNIVSVDNRGKKAILDYELVDYKEGLSLVKINLKTGRSHQIRVQFSHHNHPLYGDHKYNRETKDNVSVALFSKEITFSHPVTKDKLTFSLDLPNKYPWNIFRYIDNSKKK